MIVTALHFFSTWCKKRVSLAPTYYILIPFFFHQGAQAMSPRPNFALIPIQWRRLGWETSNWPITARHVRVQIWTQVFPIFKQTNKQTKGLFHAISQDTQQMSVCHYPCLQENQHMGRLRYPEPEYVSQNRREEMHLYTDKAPVIKCSQV